MLGAMSDRGSCSQMRVRPFCSAKNALFISVVFLVSLTTCVYSASSTDGICQSLDLRNDVIDLERLKDCEVIEGVLQISLLERTMPDDYINVTFPKLREITGYFIIYRVKGLKSIGQLFPNLAVIRGAQLFKDFALVIFELDHLENIGLKSLTTIERGSVRIEKNVRLCYANTIDWDRIAPSNPSSNYVGANKEPKLCGLCPNEASPNLPGQCPQNNGPLCWDENTCQKVCPHDCGTRACMDNGTCCDSNCLGGCNGPRAEDCHVCRHFALGSGSNRRCAQDCPHHMFKHFNRRCITESECRTEPQPKFFETDKKTTSYKPINGTCLLECPVNFGEVGSGSNLTCVPCVGVCIRHCKGSTVDSLEKAAKLKGCTHINGSLEISVRGGTNVMRELQQSLGNIVEIEGSLKITRSFAITTLYFLSSLKTIKGLKLEQKQALNIFDNPNLERLWDWATHGPIKIERGKLFVHYNPKLCYDQILPLMNMTEAPFDRFEVSEENNGDMTACSVAPMNLDIVSVQFSSVVLGFKHFCIQDYRVLLGYTIYYIKTPVNITVYDRRDACSDAWSVMDYHIKSFANYSDLDPWKCAQQPPVFTILRSLDPYTRYAAYVKAFTTLKDKKGAQSPIVYFTTKAGEPSEPLITIVKALSPNRISIDWKKPTKPNGNITEYWIQVKLQDNNATQTFTGNGYCSNPSEVSTVATLSRFRPTVTTAAPESIDENEKGFCKCSAADKKVFDRDVRAEAAEAIKFEDALQNKIYIRWKYLPPERSRRSIDGFDAIKHLASGSPDDIVPMNSTNETDSDGYFKTVVIKTDGKTESLEIDNLRNYGYYTVSIWACRAPEDNETLYNKSRCSKRDQQQLHTLRLEAADQVEDVRSALLPGNKTTPEVRITWKPPSNPNGALLSYRIRHTIMPDDSNNPPITCITHKDFLANERSYVLRNLAPGNYSIAVSATTVAGTGPFSARTFVLVPERSGREWIGGVAAGIVGAVGAVAVIAWWARRATRPNRHDKLFASVNPEYVPSVYVPDDWEVDRDSIQLIRELGQGSFGMVYEGMAKGLVKGEPETRCAVKTVNEHATDRERVDFLNEASLMKAFDTAHVVRLLGVVSQGQPTLVVMELMRLGDLKSFLRARRQDDDTPASKPQPTLQQIRQMAIEIADGMAYLSAKKFVHRDLAARNCMVAEDHTVKVGDFGMTRDIYETDYYRKGSKGLLPVRWMSPESLKDGVFSSHSDAWSYGVVLWEMATLAMQPYQGLSNEQVLRYVVEGGVMERPARCPEGLYELMRWCWRHRPDERPAFLQLVAELAQYASPRFRQRSFFHTPQAQELYAHYSTACGATEQIEEADRVAPGSRLASWVRSVTRSHTPEPEQRALVLKPQTNGIRRAAEPC